MTYLDVYVERGCKLACRGRQICNRHYVMLYALILLLPFLDFVIPVGTIMSVKPWKAQQITVSNASYGEC